MNGQSNDQVFRSANPQSSCARPEAPGRGALNRWKTTAKAILGRDTPQEQAFKLICRLPDRDAAQGLVKMGMPALNSVERLFSGVNPKIRWMGIKIAEGILGHALAAGTKGEKEEAGIEVKRLLELRNWEVVRMAVRASAQMRDAETVGKLAMLAKEGWNNTLKEEEAKRGNQVKNFAGVLKIVEMKKNGEVGGGAVEMFITEEEYCRLLGAAVGGEESFGQVSREILLRYDLEYASQKGSMKLEAVRALGEMGTPEALKALVEAFWAASMDEQGLLCPSSPKAAAAREIEKTVRRDPNGLMPVLTEAIRKYGGENALSGKEEVKLSAPPEWVDEALDALKGIFDRVSSS